MYLDLMAFKKLADLDLWCYPGSAGQRLNVCVVMIKLNCKLLPSFYQKTKLQEQCVFMQIVKTL